MRHIRLLPLFILIALCLLPTNSNASATLPKLDLTVLDSCIAVKRQTNARYEQRLANMKQQLSYAKKDHAKRSRLLYELYQSYSSYQFDSALVYIKKCQEEAEESHDAHQMEKIQLNKALLLAYGGFYNNAEEIIKSVDYNRLPDDLRYDYAIAAYWTYVFWSAFTMDNEFSKSMDSLRTRYLYIAIQYSQKGSANWYYLMGEKSYFMEEDPAKTVTWYLEVLRRERTYGRLMSQAAFAAARSYKMMHNDLKYGQYLILSAKSDLLGSVKENAALQELAMYVFNQDPDNATLAHHYLMVAMNDATFFNNKLRKLEISNRLPPIVAAYQQQLKEQSHRQMVFIIAVIVLAIGAFVLFILSRLRNKQLHLSQKLLEHRNSQLYTANAQLKNANVELSRLNGLLEIANRKREEYLRLFVDISASTMERINNYRNLVKLKIKTNQTKDLLKTVNSDRIASQDLAKFYIQFDKAFLGLYPNFVDEFIKLLEPGTKVELNKDGTMTTGLRIFAFIRLGVTESSEIATLLSYSPHTIYNYRSAMKSHAIDKEHFEDNVKQLCEL